MQEDLRAENVSPLNRSNTSGSRAKKMRLDNPLDFLNCFLKRKRTYTHAFVIQYLENDLEHVRLGIRIAKKKIKITQIKSRIGYSRKAKATLDALGLRKINQSIIVDLNDAIHGMIKKIDYLIKVEEVK